MQCISLMYMVSRDRVSYSSASLTKGIFQIVARLICTFFLLVLASAALAQDGFEAIKPKIDRIAAAEIDRAADESVRYLDRPIATEGNCRRIDLRAYQQENPYFMTDFQIQISTCAELWAPLFWKDWEALEFARTHSDPEYYSVAVETKLALSGADNPEGHVVKLAIARDLIANHNAGMSQAEVTMQAFEQCIAYTNEFANWFSETYPPIPPVRREQNRGQIICGQ